jgi:FKBP-type peptidyl-prolyl cis-trans isomerase FkpA/FKBP-type peptidyl-prolyl cis-trans isomerase FklB
LQYQVLTEGKGAKPQATDTVRVHYKGTLLDGKTFDSSYDRGEPATFPLNQVVPGWQEGIALMPIGSKYKFWIPSKLGYGDKGTPGGPIPPNATLVFEVELLDIAKQDAK